MSLKEGWLRKWSVNKNQWCNVYCKLLPSGWFQWFDNASCTSPKRSVDVRGVTAFLAFGDVLHRVPCKPSSITPAEIPQAFGIPHEPRPETKVSFFVCSSPAEMNSWMNAITSLIQCGNTYQAPGAPMGPTPTQSMPSAMPPLPGVIGFGGFSDAPPPYSSYQTPAYPNNPPSYGQPSVPYSQPQVPVGPSGSTPYYGAGAGGSYPRQPPPPQGQTSYYTQPAAGQQFVSSSGQPYEIVYVKGKPKKKKVLKNAAVGLASGLAGGYLASKMFGGWGRSFGGGWGYPCGGGWGMGMGRWGSWSSFSSFSFSD